MSVTETFSSTWRSPSNIALIKYWGKHGDQLPDNPSISITLSNAHTETDVIASHGHGLRFWFEGKEVPAFAARVEKYIHRLEKLIPEIQGMRWEIHSQNSFPHSSGIASSASAMSALALCIADVREQIIGVPSEKDALLQEISEFARLGSGSACRSVFGPVALWGRTDLIQGSSDRYAVIIDQLHEAFRTFHDSILIVDDGIKSVSSSAGHALMQGHPFGEARNVQVQAHLKDLLPAMQSGDIERAGLIIETEALTLHALMMSSTPSYMLLKPNTISILNLVRAFREATRLPVYFTLDAGPNVHLLYPHFCAHEVRAWIDGELLRYCREGKVIHDQAGMGPSRITDLS